MLVYYVNELIPQGEGPVILRDKNLLTTGLGDAFFVVGDVVTIPGTGITLTVLAGTGGAPFNIQVDYTAPVTDYNVFITRGDTINGKFYSWLQPGHLGRLTEERLQPRRRTAAARSAGEPGRRTGQPHLRPRPQRRARHGVRLRRAVPDLRAVSHGRRRGRLRQVRRHQARRQPGRGRETRRVRRVDAGRLAATPHACVKVDLINLVGTDTNEHDNWAQENLEIVTSVTSSPFHPVTYRYNLTNPYERAALFYFRADGVPDGWDVDLIPRKICLSPGERMLGEVTITPPEEAEVCTSERIR